MAQLGVAQGDPLQYAERITRCKCTRCGGDRESIGIPSHL
jgi:hypothetical protein